MSKIMDKDNFEIPCIRSYGLDACGCYSGKKKYDAIYGCLNYGFGDTKS